jgi:hypothetical protein
LKILFWTVSSLFSGQRNTPGRTSVVRLERFK